ncbi:MAG: beta-propeller domain-containing protein [Candidatus Uhrbacteria bacterium]|nr:beta-propeller domain-containing protein [Candidatus Uhrbacteria bacterium]
MSTSLGYDLQKDSDGDGYSDAIEITNNYTPYGPGKMPIDVVFTKKLRGRILLQVEERGEAWYVEPLSSRRYFLGRSSDALAMMRWFGLGISNADLSKITVDKMSATHAVIAPFATAAEFTEYVTGLQKKQKEEQKTYSSLGQYFSVAPTATSALTEATSSSSASITNTQEKGVDEGDIVKAYDDYLIVLRRGRLFTIRLAESEKPVLSPIVQMNVFPDELSGQAWYDEMLVTGNTIIVVGYRYSQRATEINLFTINKNGTLARGQTYFLDSDDYYSSRNYTSRLIGTKLIFYVPYYPHWSDEKRGPSDLLPSLRKWVSAEDTTDLPLIREVDVAKTSHDELYPTLHTVVVCDVGSELSCSAKAVFGPASRNYYVSKNAVYLWVTDTSTSSEKPREPNAYIYRLDLATGGATVVRADGSPIDQFSFQEKDGMLNVLVRSSGGGDAMWNSEHSSGSLALLRIPVSQFARDPILVSKDLFTPLPEPKGYGFQNRFVGDTLLYGAGGDWSDTTSDPQFLYVKKVITNDPAQAVPLSHTLDRIDVMGTDAVVIGKSSSESALLLSSLELDPKPRVTDTFTVSGASQGELRSHGLFYFPYSDGTGILGLPIRKQGDATSSYVSDSASVLFLNTTAGKKFVSLGELGGADQTQSFDDNCVASCVDWYGNARPIFYRDRIFGLLGYELVEGLLKDAKIEKARSANFYRK